MAPRRWIDSRVEHPNWAVWFVGGEEYYPPSTRFTEEWKERKKEDVERVGGRKEKEAKGDDNVVLQIIIVESWLPFRVLMESLYFCILFIFSSPVDETIHTIHPIRL